MGGGGWVWVGVGVDGWVGGRTGGRVGGVAVCCVFVYVKTAHI